MADQPVSRDWLRPMIVVADRCPHSQKPISRASCSMCLGAKARQVSTVAALPDKAIKKSIGTIR